jgi:predicted PurR-regulated permease PerM
MEANLRGATSGSALRWVLTAAVVAILLAAVWEVRATLMLVFSSIVLVTLFTIPIRYLMRRGMRRTPATLVSLLGVLAVVVVLLLAALPSLLQQFGALATDVQEGVTEFTNQWEKIQADPQLRETYPYSATLQDVVLSLTGKRDLNEIIGELTRQFGSAIGELSGSVFPVVSGVASSLLSLIISIFLSLYLLAEPRKYEDGMIKLFPLWYRMRVRFIVDRIDFTLRTWIQGQLLLMIAVGFLTWFGLTLLGLNQALALGVLAGLFSFVPNFGPIAALIPSVAVAIVQVPQNIGWVILIIYGASFLQSQVIAPLLFKESINLPPVLVLIGQIFAAVFLGFIGLMLAVPLMAILMILVQEVYIKDILGDTEPRRVLAWEEELLPDGS